MNLKSNHPLKIILLSISLGIVCFVVHFLDYEYDLGKLASNSLKNSHKREVIPSREKGHQLNLLFIGDCFIAPPKSKKSFPHFLADYIEKKYNLKVHVTIKTYGGLSSATISAKINSWMNERKYDLIFTSFGIGDFLNSFVYQESFSNKIHSYFQNLTVVRFFKIQQMSHHLKNLGERLNDVRSGIIELESKLRKDSSDYKLQLQLSLLRHYAEFLGEPEYKDYHSNVLKLFNSLKTNKLLSQTQKQEVNYLFCVFELCDKNSSLTNNIIQFYSNEGKVYPVAFKDRVQFSNQKYFPSLSENYNNIMDKIKRKGQLVIPILHPLTSSNEFKKIVDKHPDLKIVDNELYFKKILKKSTYNEIFIDRMLGNTGNFTKKGHQLMAQQIMRLLEKEYSQFLN